MCGYRPIQNPIEKARDRISRRGLYDFRDDVNMRVICPTCQTFLGL
jgi:hypothetical protein